MMVNDILEKFDDKTEVIWHDLALDILDILKKQVSISIEDSQSLAGIFGSGRIKSLLGS